MTTKEKLKKNDEDIARERHKQKRAQDREKQLKRRRAKLVRDQRTHRLCVRGGMLESFLKRPGCIDPAEIEDEQLRAFLVSLLSLPGAESKLTELLPPSPDGTDNERDGDDDLTS